MTLTLHYSRQGPIFWGRHGPNAALTYTVEAIFITLSASSLVTADRGSAKGRELVEERGRVSSGMSPVLVVIDSDCCVKYCTFDGTIDEQLLRLLSEDRKALRAEVEELVRSLISVCACSPCLADCKRFRVATLSDGSTLRVVPLVGANERLFALSLELDETRNGLTRAARRFQLTRRESEVLALILEGFSAAEIGRNLHIAENTVQGYFKRLLSKTNSRNRPSMVANVLDWDRSRFAGSVPNARPCTPRSQMAIASGTVRRGRSSS